jgi:hypothetical protein
VPRDASTWCGQHPARAAVPTSRGELRHQSASTGAMGGTASRAGEEEEVGEEFRFLVGVDWGEGSYQVCILSLDGRIEREIVVGHSGAALEGFVRRHREPPPLRH